MPLGATSRSACWAAQPPLSTSAGGRFRLPRSAAGPGKPDSRTKTVGPGVPAAALGTIDVVLVSHDQHPDNFDDEGRQVALAAPLGLTHPGGAERVGPRGAVLTRKLISIVLARLC